MKENLPLRAFKQTKACSGQGWTRVGVGEAGLKDNKPPIQQSARSPRLHRRSPWRALWRTWNTPRWWWRLLSSSSPALRLPSPPSCRPPRRWCPPVGPRHSRDQSLARARRGSDVWELSYLGQALGGQRVVPTLHVVAREFVLTEHSHRLAFFAASDGLDHLVKVAFVAFILQVMHYKRNGLQKPGIAWQPSTERSTITQLFTFSEVN